MVTIALGVLVLTALVTAGLARRTEANNARGDLNTHAPIVAKEFDTLLQQVPAGAQRRSRPWWGVASSNASAT